MHQPIMKTAARQVQLGKWLHVFPEGKLFVDGSMGPFKWGIGKMVCDSMEGGRRSAISGQSSCMSSRQESSMNEAQVQDDLTRYPTH